jgi:putative copper export protein
MAPTRTLCILITSGLLALATVVAYWLMLGRDTSYYLDPATGSYAGPYTTGQVAAFALTVLALLVAAVLARLHPLLAAAVVTLGVLVPWTANAASTDETGMYGVGAFMILAGVGTGSWIIAMLVRTVADRARHRPVKS